MDSKSVDNHLMKLYILLLLSLLGTAHASTCETRNHVFLIHGIGGNAKTFGVMDRYLKKTDPCIVPESYVYQTKSSKLSTLDFAKLLDVFIAKNLSKNNFKDSDRISLVMHSQGGIIGSFWLMNVRATNPSLYQKIDSFITLSTPFYGSKIAKLGKEVLFSLAAKNGNPVSPMGKIQLQDMSYGSEAIRSLANNFSQIFENTHIRFLSLSGEKAISNRDVGQGDTTVSPYSANPNHYKYVVSVNDVITDHHLGVVPYSSVRGTHIPFISKGIAYVGRDCLIRSECGHEALALIQDHLDGKKLELPKKEFFKYRIHVYVTGKNRNLTAVITDASGKSESTKLNPKEDGVVTGSLFANAEDAEEKTLELKLYDNNHLIRTDRILYRGGFSTFVEYE